jgi:hypothetical protein
MIFKTCLTCEFTAPLGVFKNLKIVTNCKKLRKKVIENQTCKWYKRRKDLGGYSE